MFKIETNDQLGRHLIATRNIKRGEIILQEEALVSGPAQFTGPVCLGPCGQLLHPPAVRPCDLCGWPMCGAEKCRTAPIHQPECEYTIMRGTKIAISSFLTPHPTYSVITILRMLHLKQNNPKKWDKLSKLFAHEDSRKLTEKYDQDRIQIAQFILRFFKLNFSEEEIMWACGILQVNGHEVPLSDPPSVAIYAQTSLFEHNCRPNCAKSFTPAGAIIIHATQDVGQGENLSICYTDGLWGTPNRRHYLWETKFFGCQCGRCGDVTEGGTMFSALRCMKNNCTGFLLPQSFLWDCKNPPETKWHCNSCANTSTSSQIEKILERIGCDLNAMKKGDVKSCKLFLDYYEKLLHPNHYYLTDVRLALVQIIGHGTDQDIDEKVRICTKLNELLEVLNPAEVRVRGNLLFELHAALAEKANRKSSQKAELPEFQQLLIRSREALISAVQLLQHEPEELPEGQIYVQAKINLTNLDEVLQKLHLTLGDSPI